MEPRDEDDFIHYFNATGRLAAENERLRAALKPFAAIRNALEQEAREAK